MNQFKQKKAVAECWALRRGDRCPRECVHWVKRGMPFCKDAYSAEKRK